MKILKECGTRDYYFDNGVKDMPALVTVILDSDWIIVDFQAIIDTQFSGGNVPNKFEGLKRMLGLGEFSSAPGGGFINFFSVFSQQNVEYILFSDVNEVYNSHYIVTVHKVIKL
jgi:hypothetical protein